MHIDDIDYLVNSRSGNFVIGMKLSEDKPTVYINFINPKGYDFFAALRDICTEVTVAPTATKAQANAIAYAHAKMKSTATDSSFSNISVSVDEHVSLSADNGFLPVIMLKSKRILFHWFSSAHMNKPAIIGQLTVNEVLSSTSNAIANRLTEFRDDSIFIDEDDDSHMHYKFWHS